MSSDQAAIKLVLITVFAGIALFVVIPGRGQRGKALQRLAWLLVILMAVIAVAIPDLTTRVAHMMGVGRWWLSSSASRWWPRAARAKPTGH